MFYTSIIAVLGCVEEILSQVTSAVKSIQEVHKLNQYLTVSREIAGSLGQRRRLGFDGKEEAETTNESSTAESSIKRIRSSVGIAVAGILTLNWSLFGFLKQQDSIDSTTVDSVTSEVKKCQVCGVSSSATVKLNKCSKCKATPVYYCCRDHQVSDWPKHKVLRNWSMWELCVNDITRLSAARH